MTFRWDAHQAVAWTVMVVCISSPYQQARGMGSFCILMLGVYCVPSGVCNGLRWQCMKGASLFSSFVGVFKLLLQMYGVILQEN